MEKANISVRGGYDPQYAILVDHEGYTPVGTAAQVQINLKDIEYAINKKVDRDAIDFAIRRLKQPFFVIPKKYDLVSRSGQHSVEFSDSSPRGLYVLEKELIFPRPRPKMQKLKNFHREYIAWVVSRDQVHKLWILKYARSPDYIELTIPDFELERLQGNLYYTHVELDEETKYTLPLRAKFRIFNHEFEYDTYAASFVHNDGVYAIVHTYSLTGIHSEDHETVTLEPGTYLLYHPFPRREGVSFGSKSGKKQKV